MKKVVLVFLVLFVFVPVSFAESVIKSVTLKSHSQNQSDIAQFTKQLQTARQAKSPIGEAYYSYRIAIIHYNMQNTLEALKYFRQSEAASKLITGSPDKTFLAVLNANLGHILLVTGQADQARLYLKKAQSYDAYCPIVKDFEKEISTIQTTGDYFASLEDDLMRWNDETTEIKVYVTPDKPELITQIKQAFSDWENAINKRLTFSYVDNPNKSDVMVKWSHMPIPDKSGRLGGRCDIQVDDENYFIHTDLLIRLFDNQRNPVSSYQLYSTMIHEIGHLLGLDHSPSPIDVMFPERGHRISQRDSATFQILYNTKPVQTNKPGLTVSEYRIQNGFE